MTDRSHDCIQACWTARHECQKMLYTTCLETGGEHTAPEHVKLMADCIEICQVTADFLTRHSENHALLCHACAIVCEHCAASCEHVGGMEECVKACRDCARICRKMVPAFKRSAA